MQLQGVLLPDFWKFTKHEAYLNFEDSRQREGRQRLPQDVRVA